MRALTYHGSHDVRVESVPDPLIEDPQDILLKVTATAICGSDLHLYRGKIPQMKDGDILGHEFMGIVEETGKEVTAVKKGDRVIVPFVIACGDCFFCKKEFYSACETTNSGSSAAMHSHGLLPGAAMFGYSHMYGGISGGQAEMVRVPQANTGPFKIENNLPDEKVLFLTDILPTGYQAVLNANVGKGSTLAIFGAGPVGLMAAACAKLMGVETIFMVDHHDYRLEFAAKNYGVIPINFDKVDDVSKLIIEKTKHHGVDGAIEAVGFEAKGNMMDTTMTTLKLEGSSGEALRQCIACVRRCGTVSIPGVYAGMLHGFLLGDAFDKGISFKMGQTHVQKFLPDLMQFIENDQLNPEIIITHVMSLEEAAKGYEIFDKKEQDCRKVILKPGMTGIQRLN